MKIFILIISILSSLPISYAQNVWESTGGPDVGDITHVLSINDSILMAGSQGGNIYKSTDFGDEWFIVVETRGDGVPGMVVTSDNTVFASVSPGVYKSTDYGITWNHIFGNMEGYLYLSRDEELLFLIPDHVRYYFMYGTVQGNSWTYIYLPFTGYLFQFSQNQMQDIWVLCSSEGVYISTDNGINWEARNSGLLTTNVRSILINDNDETFIGTIDGVYYSSNFGMDWELRNQGIPANTIIYDFIELSDSILVIGSSKGSFITYDKGISWYVLSNKINDLRISSLTHFGFNNILLGSNTGTYIFSDSILQRKSIGISEIAIYDVNQVGNRLFAGSRNGLYYSDNGGDKWLFIDEVPQLFIRNIETDSPYVYFITNNYGWGLWRSSDEGNNWMFIEQQGCCTELISFSNHYLSAGLFYPDPHLPPHPYGVWYSSDFGNIWNEGVLPGLNIVHSLGKDLSERLFIGAQDLTFTYDRFRLYISTNYGITGTSSDSGLPNARINCIETDLDNNVYLGTDLGIYISTNHGSNWSLYGMENTIIKSIQFDEYNNIFAVTIENISDYGIYRSTDGGLNFIDFSTGLENRSLGKLFLSENDYLYIGTNFGAYKTVFPITTDITELNQSSPNYFALSQNYPNPFNPTTTIQYQIPQISFVTIIIYDVLGNEITSLVNEEKPIGIYEVEFDGSVLPSGIYFYQLRTNKNIETKKMVLLK